MSDPRFVGFRVHGWTYPLVWWARRKPQSRLRQWAWDNIADRIQWRKTLRFRAKLARMTDAELEAHLRKRYDRAS